ncbi:fused MFS/spermidine synthase [Neorhodopirellula pilleata]|uniref:Spermidine synthase n=1 Tax=Neorhodopirellula pilleata TaxID=2714738 RepID=A0A5C6APA1_9BACT|nr:fused MFS/spermidine synthase [Neorhodopirellula pilleata]TWU01510.1 Spermidine synthase [Neorhodopirellula pilleata]
MKQSPDTFLVVAVCFWLSGFAALLYETVWLRLFSIQFGTSEQSLAIVLSTYMGGLALGSLLAGWWLSRDRNGRLASRPLLVYGILELGIAATALLVPTVLWAVRYVQIGLYGGADAPPDAGDFSQISFAFGGAFLATILPTTMMGATLPMLSKHVVYQDAHLGKRIGALYAINTLGAVMGTLLAAFVCLPHLGLFRTILVGVAINVLVFLIVALILRPTSISTARSEQEPIRSTAGRAGESPEPPGTRMPAGSLPAADWVLLLIGCSGAVSFVYEILFTRMLGHVLGGSLFAFASMLAAFLTGITIGGAIAARLAPDRHVASRGFFYAQCFTALLALGSWYGLESLAGWINELSLVRQTESVPRVLFSVLLLVPPAIAIGMSFPWAIRIHARGEHDAAGSSAKVYACGTIGSVIGAFITGTYLLPMSNYQTTLIVAMMGNLIIAACFLFWSQIPKNHFALIAIIVLVGGWAFPTQPSELLRVSSFENYVRGGQLTFVHTGRSATVTIHNQAGAFLMSTNGLPEATASPKGSMFNWKRTTNWLGVLPASLFPEAETMLVVGFGGGVAPAHAPDSVREIDVFELEEGMIQANRIVAPLRQRDPITDHRIRIILNDGRSGLALTQRKYDIIVSQPSHPWTAGASHLYTREFAQLACDHLTDQGVFVLWMDRQFVDLDLFRSLAATMGDVFEHIALFQPNESALLFVGLRSSIDWTQKNGRELYAVCRSMSDRALYRQMGLNHSHALVAALALDDEGLRRLSENAPITTDNNNLLAMKRIRSDEHERNKNKITEAINEYDPLVRESTIGRTFDSDARLAILLRRFAAGRDRNAERLLATIDDLSRREFAQGYLALANKELEKALHHFQLSTSADPSYQPAWVNQYLVMRESVSANDSDQESLRNLSASVIEQLRSPYSAIAEAIEAMREKDYSKMKAIDDKLARFSVENPVFGTAAILRVQWREIDPSSGSVRSRGQENLKLLESCIPYLSEKDLAMFRLRAAVLAGRPKIVLTTAQMIAERINGELDPLAVDSGEEQSWNRFDESDTDPVNLPNMQIKLQNCLTAIAPLEGDSRVARSRFYGVRMMINQALADVQQRMAN